MELEQQLSEEELEQVEAVFEKTFAVSSDGKSPWATRWVKVGFVALAVLLFVLSFVMYKIDGEITPSIWFYLVFGAVALCGPLLITMVEKQRSRMPKQVVQQMYGVHYMVVFKEDVLEYRNHPFTYDKVTYVILYRQFFFLYVADNWLVIRAEDDQKEAIMEQLKRCKNARYYQKSEPFDLKEYQQEQMV